MRGRLTRYDCTSQTGQTPQDRHGNHITRQEYDFDALDNITACRTWFADGSRDSARFFFADDDPCQLVRVTHDHPSYPRDTELEYDADGNLLYDENGQRLAYDSLGRLLEVTNPDGLLDRIRRVHDTSRTAR